jgi:3-oxoacyl-[acyl-carrier protein] reductase
LNLGIEGKVALVMGASKGLGRASAAALAREGARVAMSSRAEEQIREAAADVAGEAVGFAADTDDVDKLPKLVERVEAALGPIEILVTNTGGPPLGDSLSFDREQWEAAYRSLVLAPMALIEAVVPGMRERGWGRIVNIASMAGKDGNPNMSPYSASKAAVIALTKSLGKELATTGVLANAIAPAVIETPMNAATAPDALAHITGLIPMKRLGRAEEVAELIAWLASDRVSFSTGAVYDISGGRATY